MKTTDYLELLRSKTKTGSDYAISKLLDTTRQKISGYKNKGITFSDEMAIKVAHILNIPEGEVLADMHAERANCTEVETAWKVIAAQLRRTAAAVALAIVGIGATALPDQAVASTSQMIDQSPRIYIMLNNMR